MSSGVRVVLLALLLCGTALHAQDKSSTGHCQGSSITRAELLNYFAAAKPIPVTVTVAQRERSCVQSDGCSEWTDVTAATVKNSSIAGTLHLDTTPEGADNDRVGLSVDLPNGTLATLSGDANKQTGQFTPELSSVVWIRTAKDLLVSNIDGHFMKKSAPMQADALELTDRCMYSTITYNIWDDATYKQYPHVVNREMTLQFSFAL